MKKTYLLICSLFFISSTFPQIVYEPLYHDVYNFLERLSQKGIIDFNDLFKPVSKKYIYEKLLEANDKITLLTNLEREELEFFEKDYFLEKKELNNTLGDEKNLGFFKQDSSGRSRMFFYSDKILKMNASPVLGYELTFHDKERNTHSWNGLYSYGYLPNNIGASFDFRINYESGTYLDHSKSFTPVTGVIGIQTGKTFDYSEVKSMISIDWGWGNAVIAKEFLEYGYAKSGNLVLSNKAPSFPFILLQLNPAKWINFYYFHAWLSSNVIDSLRLAEYRRDIFINKFFAWHTLIITPLNGLDISLGESIVYSEKVELVYLMPFMFFFLADDYIDNRHDQPGDANSQFFLSVSSKNHLKNTHLYGTLFVDEITVRGIHGTIFIDGDTFKNNSDSRKLRLQLGYTLGASVTDLLADNLTLTAEYTRINPFVYGHHTPAQTYTNSSYLMGHWMGHNSDLVHLELNYRFLRGFQMNLWGEYIRKGSPDYSGQYIQPQPEFLFGLKNYYKYFGANLKYELMHELNFEARFRHNVLSSEVSVGSFADDQVNELSFSIYYGL